MAKKSTYVMKIYNCSKQLVQLQLKPPGADFYTSEQQVRLMPGKDVTVLKSHLRQDQIENLKKRRLIKVIYDSESKEQVVSI